MKKNLLFTLLLFSASLPGFSTTHTISNSSMVFNPSTIIIDVGDEIFFDISQYHQAREVSADTWNADQDTPLAGGFQTPFDGGLVTASQLEEGNHYFVCTAHVESDGMKGIIFVVDSPNSISEKPVLASISIYPNPVNDILSIRAGGDIIGSAYILTDMNGRQLLNGKLFTDLTSIDISQLAAGVYLLQIADKNKQTLRVEKK